MSGEYPLLSILGVVMDPALDVSPHTATCWAGLQAPRRRQTELTEKAALGGQPGGLLQPKDKSQ